MNLPATLKLLGHEVEVKMFDHNDNPNDDKMGYCRPALNVIGIDLTMPKTKQEETLIHEILEYFNSDMDLQLDHDKLSVLAVALYEFLKYNNFNIFDGAFLKK